MDPQQTRRIGMTDLEVTQFGIGGATLGDPGAAIEESQAQATLAAAYDAGLRFFDTAPWYGNTKSEHRFGQFLRDKPRDSYRISTKVGRVYFRPDDPVAFEGSPWVARWPGGLRFDLRFDYTADGILRSYEDSLMRLGINRVDALVIHDLDPRHQNSEAGVAKGLAQLRDGGFAALADLKARGEISAIGAGINHIGMIPRFLAEFDIDYFLVAMPYTLLDQPALDSELPLCESKGVSVVIGAVFASGILATGPKPGALYGYQPAPAETLRKVARIQAVCGRHNVPLAAAALQFPLAHPEVASVIPGPNSPDQMRQNLELMRVDVPTALWDDLKQENLIHAASPTPA